MVELKKVTIWGFLFTQLLNFMLVISLFAAVSGFADGTTEGFRFHPGWAGFFLMLFSIYANLALFRWADTYSYGILVGGYAFTVMYSLDIAVYFGTLVQEYRDAKRDEPASFQAVAALGALYFVFSLFVAIAFHLFKDDMIVSAVSNKSAPPPSGNDGAYDMRHVDESDV